MNLLKETKEKLKQHGKFIKNVLWVGNEELFFDWNHFCKIANIDYDSSYGAPEIACDLKIVGSDWWLERHEYDGSEHWEYKELPLKPKDNIKINFVKIRPDQTGWEDIESINNL